MGLVLVNMFLYDLFLYQKEAKPVNSANNNTIYAEHKGIENLPKLLEQEEEALMKWFKENEMIVNLWFLWLQTVTNYLQVLFRKGKVSTGVEKASIPVHWKNVKESVKNYYPISLLPVCGKIFERLLFNSLFNFLI